ncbi:hypothetical protein D3C75_1106840 [compost metagenome]
MADGKARHLGVFATARLEGLDSQLCGTVPALERAAMVTVAMALDITQPEVEVFCQARQHWLVDQTAKAVAVEKMQQGFAAGG